MIDPIFGARLRSLRKAADLSAEKLATALGIHRNSVVGYESGGKEPGISILRGLHSAGLDWVYFASGQTRQEFTNSNFDWDLLAEIYSRIEARQLDGKLNLTPSQKSAAAKTVYLQATYRQGLSDDILSDTLKVAA